MKVKIEYGAFGPKDSWQDLEGRLAIGVVDFMFVKKEDGSVRTARGTRDLDNHNVNWDLLPMNIKTPPSWVLTFIDVEKSAWRCFIKNNLIWYSDEVEIDD